MLPNFEIQNFRTFSRLRVDRLGRVNLIVGRNNVGKTMFLDALRLYASGGSALALRNLLLERDEVVTDVAELGMEEADFHLRIASLFHRRLHGERELGDIQLGPLGSDATTLTIQARMLYRVRSGPGPGSYSWQVVGEGDAQDDPAVTPGLLVNRGATPQAIFPVHHLAARHHRLIPGYDNLTRPAFVSARGATDREVARWWDAVALRDAEQRVIDCLRLIAPVERINLVEHPARRGDRLVLVKMAGDAVPVPLKSLGDGMARMFQIALALECTPLGPESERVPRIPDPALEEKAPEPLLLLDEVENGIHYTVLPDLWRFILRVAQLHDIQVFATSHSWDCILGLQAAAVDVPDAQAMLVRLERLPHKTKAVVFDQKELAIVARDEIEVR